MQQKNQSKGEIASLYILKALCAWGVVALHAPSGVVTPYIQLIASIAVPLFFMITGYFLYTDDSTKLMTRVSSSIKKVLIVILITHLVYTAMFWQGIPPLHDWVLWAKWILMGQHYKAGHLWYLTALVEALALFWFVARLGYARYIGFFASFWLFRFIFEDYRELIFGSPASFLSANAIFYSIPCVATGLLIHKYQTSLLQIKHWGILATSVIISIYIAKFGIHGNLSTILVPILRLAMILSIFMLALKHIDFGKGSAIEYVGKKLSGNIYYWHDMMIVLTAAYVSQSVFDNWAAPIAAVLSTILAYLIVALQKKLNVNYLP